MNKQVVLSSIALALTGLTQVGCYVEPRERVVYREYRQPAPVVVDQGYREQYRPLPAAPPPEETVEVVEGPEVRVTEFHEQLAPYGRWLVVADYGDCFVPAEVAPGWQPYTVGHWVYTDAGMCWVSEERWGWATYHYGRWALVERVGWVWIPGSHWGPAWVSWRNGGGYCGWAPLPPGRRGVEVIDVREIDADEIPPTHYVFCEERYVTAPRVYERCLPRERNVTIINRTTNITRITVVNNRVVNQSWDSRRIAEATGRSIRPVQLHEVRTVEELKVHHEEAEMREQRQRAEEQRRAAAPAGGPDPRRVIEDPSLERRAQSAEGGGERAGFEGEMQQINQQYAQEKAQMNQRFAMERRQRPPGPGADDLMHRQAQEAAALEQRHQQEVNATRRKYRQ